MKRLLAAVLLLSASLAGAQAAPEVVQPAGPMPAMAPPTPPANPEPPAEQSLIQDQQEQAQAPASGQWVYTQQYGWVWMPYGDSYTYQPADGGSPNMYVYYPSVGWCWVVAPWIWGYGPQPYFGTYGYGRYGWYGYGYGHWYGFHGAYAGWNGRGYWSGGHWYGAPGHGGPVPYHPAAPRSGSTMARGSYAAPRSGYAAAPRSGYAAAPRGGYMAPHGGAPGFGGHPTGSFGGHPTGSFGGSAGGHSGGGFSSGGHSGGGGGGGHGGGGHR